MSLLMFTALTVCALQQATAQNKPQACPFLGQPVKATKDKVAVFAANGKFERDAPSTDLAADARVLACNEDLGLVKVRLAGAESWVDRLAVSIRPTAGVTCVAKAPTRAADRTEPVSSGIGENCKPEKSSP
jgi:hypothetical protein